MKIYHITRRRLRFTGALLLLLVLAVPILAGCFSGKEDAEEAILLPTEDAQVEFLQNLGWQVEAAPVETLDMRLPDSWDEEWTAYGKMQAEQGLPFTDFAGATVRRVTYSVTNYPHIPDGVQANLYLAGEQLIGGDIIFTGQGGFQTDLRFPAES